MTETAVVWLSTAQLCRALAVSRSTLCLWQQRKVLRQGVHCVRKNPTAVRSDQLWCVETCQALLQKHRHH